MLRANDAFHPAGAGDPVCRLAGACRAGRSAQVVVVANGSPITELDIAQRSKLSASATHKQPTRQEVINELIDDRLKLAKAKVYGFEIDEAEIDGAFENMAKRQGISRGSNSRRCSIAPASAPTRSRRASRPS